MDRTVSGAGGILLTNGQQLWVKVSFGMIQAQGGVGMYQAAKTRGQVLSLRDDEVMESASCSRAKVKALFKTKADRGS